MLCIGLPEVEGSMCEMEMSRVPRAPGSGSEGDVSQSWAPRAVKGRGKQGLYAGILPSYFPFPSLQGFVWVFFFADLVWFLNRLVYIFSAKFCKWKKTHTRP